MRRTFLLWLSAVICTAFVITVLLVYAQFARHAQDRAEQMMATRLNDMLELFLHADHSTMYLSQANDASTLDRTRALAEIVQLNPELLNDQERLQGICNLLGAEQITITDDQGTVVAAVPASMVGYNLEQSEDTRPFMACISSPGYELCLRAGSGEADQQALQFAGVHRMDQPGVVRLGFRTRLEQASRESESFSRTTAKLRMGEGSRLYIFRRGALLTGDDMQAPQAELLAISPNEAQVITLNDEKYYVYAVDGEEYRLVGAVPARRIYVASFRAVQSVLVSNLLLFVAMFAVVSYLLQRLVLRGISRVNDSLREITEGDLEKRVDVVDCPEFTRLSNGINFMVDSLRSVGEERQQGIRRDLELARTIQSTALPSKFPAFPNIESFDLCATCLQASEVGGDFYDFSMPDDRHLHFLVADVDASGIPAALFMMRAMSIIRTFARAGATPAGLVADVNRELCIGNQAGIRMALFYGSLDITTGELVYVNAGRMHALLQRQGGEYEMLGGRMDYVMGDIEDIAFHEVSLQLAPQDRLFLHTEGILSAKSAINLPYGEGRLQEALRGDAPTAADVLQLVRSSLRLFTAGTKLSDDVTMLCLEYKGEPSNQACLELYAGEPQEAEELISAQMEELFAAPLDIAAVQNSTRALLAALPPDTPVYLELDCTEQLAMVRLIYDGAELNPLPMVGPLEMDDTNFEYTENQENKLTLWKNLT